jgi:hypothetical protein
MTFSNPPTVLPPVLATGQGQSANGRQQLGSGLVTHRGIIDANTLRAQGILSPQSGRGLELVYNQGGPYGGVQSYDRDAQQYTDLYLTAKNITLQAPGGKVSLPAGTVQQVLGYWFQPSGWVPPAASQWLESDVRISYTGTGAPIRHDFATSITLPAGSTCYVGMGLDGGITWPSLALMQNGGGGTWIVPCAASIINTSTAAGPHRISIWLYYGGPQVSINASAYTSLWATEQRA